MRRNCRIRPSEWNAVNSCLLRMAGVVAAVEHEAGDPGAGEKSVAMPGRAWETGVVGSGTVLVLLALLLIVSAPQMWDLATQISLQIV